MPDRHDTVSAVSPDVLPPTGTATADLLTLEFAEPPPAAAAVAGPREAAGHSHLIGPRRPEPGVPAVLDHLDARMVAIIDRTGLGHVATADAAGHCDSAFREVRVLDRRHIAYPSQDGPPPAAVGVLLVDFTAEPVGVHITGHAREDGGWMVVEVEAARIHSAPAYAPGAG